MKRLIYIICIFCVFGCKDNPKTSEAEGTENSFFTTTFRDYREIEVLSNHTKVSDTSIFTGELEDDFRLLRLRKNTNDLVLFYKVVDRDSMFHQVLDTLQINDLKKDERLSIGYCYNKAFYMGEIISLVQDTDSLQVQDIIKAWRANPETGAIEALEEFEDIICLNEEFDGQGQPVSIKHLNLSSRAEY